MWKCLNLVLTTDLVSDTYQKPADFRMRELEVLTNILIEQLKSMNRLTVS